MTLFVKLCATEEGFWKSGTVPNRNNNPMDLRHSLHSEHPGDLNAIGAIDTVARMVSRTPNARRNYAARPWINAAGCDLRTRTSERK